MWSIWERTGFHRDADLVVVGGGLVGLFTALFHQRARPGDHVVVLEQGAFPAGASVRNAGFACFGSPSELLADIAAEGEAAALARVEERWRGLLELRAELGDGNIGFEASGGHELFMANDPLYTHVAQGFDGLNKALSPILGAVAYRWIDTSIKPLVFKQVEHLARTDLEGPLDSGMLMRTLLRKTTAEGVLFRGGSTVTGVEENSAQVVVQLQDGSSMRAAHVVVATNGYSTSLLPGIDVLPARGQVLLTGPVPGLSLRGTYHMDEGYIYFREYQGGVLLGGGRNLDPEGERTTDDGVTPLIQEHLEKLLRSTILPNIPHHITHRWSGVMGFRSKGKQPLVERLGERMVVAAGLSGMGVAIGIRVARQAAALVG